MHLHIHILTKHIHTHIRNEHFAMLSSVWQRRLEHYWRIINTYLPFLIITDLFLNTQYCKIQVLKINKFWTCEEVCQRWMKCNCCWNQNGVAVVSPNSKREGRPRDCEGCMPVTITGYSAGNASLHIGHHRCKWKVLLQGHRASNCLLNLTLLPFLLTASMATAIVSKLVILLFYYYYFFIFRIPPCLIVFE